MSITIDKIKELEEKEIKKKELIKELESLKKSVEVKKKSIQAKKDSLYNDVFNSILTFKSQAAQASEIKDLYNVEKDDSISILDSVTSLYKTFLSDSKALKNLVDKIVAKYNLVDISLISDVDIEGYESKSDNGCFIISSGDGVEIDLTFNKIKDILVQKFSNKVLSLDIQ